MTNEKKVQVATTTAILLAAFTAVFMFDDNSENRRGGVVETKPVTGRAGSIPAGSPTAGAKGDPIETGDVSHGETNGAAGPAVKVTAESVTGATSIEEAAHDTARDATGVRPGESGAVRREAVPHHATGRSAVESTPRSDPPKTHDIGTPLEPEVCSDKRMIEWVADPNVRYVYCENARGEVERWGGPASSRPGGVVTGDRGDFDPPSAAWDTGIYRPQDDELRVVIRGEDVGPPSPRTLFDLYESLAARTRPIRPAPQIVRLDAERCVVVAPNASTYTIGTIERPIGAPFMASACYCQCTPTFCDGSQSLLVRYADGEAVSVPQVVPR